MRTTKDPQQMVKTAKKRLNSKIEKQRKIRQAAKKRSQIDSILGKVIWVILALALLVWVISKIEY